MLIFYNFKLAHKTKKKYLFIFRMLVGAPLGQNLQPQTNRSGALFKCPLTGLETDCVQVVTDGKRGKNLHMLRMFMRRR